MITYNTRNLGYDLFDLFDDFYTPDTRGYLHTEYPYVNVYEGNDEVTVRAALPGIKADELSIEIKNDLLTIEGEKKADYADVSYLRKERTFGKFQRAITLPYAVDAGKIRAELKDGVLSITLPKSEDAKPKKIEIR